MFIIFFLSVFVGCCPHGFKQGQARPVHESSDQPAQKSALSN